MTASDDAYSKAWYGRQLDRLHREAPKDEQTTPQNALRHLPVECLAEVLDTTFQNYETRASGFAERCLAEGDMDTYHAFIKAHHDILEQFDLPAPNHYRDMASIIGAYFIRKKEKQLGFTQTTVTKVRTAPAPRMPDSPLSESPAPPSISSWIKNVQQNTFKLPPPIQQGVSKPLIHTPEDSSPRESMNLEHTARHPTTNTPEDSFAKAPTKINLQSSKQTPSLRPLQQRPPRKAKKLSVVLSPPKTSGRGPTTRPGKGQITANQGPMIVADAETNMYKQSRGSKRPRAEDVMLSDDANIAQKRRKIVKPARKSKR